MEEGFDVSRINDTFTIKSGEMYSGIITKEGDIKRTKDHQTFAAMVKELG